MDDPSQFGIVETDEKGKVLRFVEKPQPGETVSRNASAGTYVFEPSVLKRMPGDAKLSIERVVFPSMVEEGQLFAMATDDYWIDAGRPDTYISANIHVAKLHDSAVHKSAVIEKEVLIIDSVIGENVRIASGASIRHSVLLPGAVIQSGAHVENSLVMGMVGSGASIEQCIVGADGSVPANLSATDTKFPSEDKSTT